MLVIISAAAVSILMFAWLTYLNWHECDEWRSFDGAGFVLGETVVSFFSAIAFVAIFFGGMGIANLSFDHEDHYAQVELVALRDSTGQTSNYVWGTGSSVGTGNYVFYYREGGASRLVNLNATEVLLYEDTDKPYAVIYEGCELSASWVAECFSNSPRFTELHVPPGSVVQQIDLDLGEN